MPQSEKLYRGADINIVGIEDATEGTFILEALEELLAPSPNASVFGTYASTHFYRWAEGKKKGLKFTLNKKMGGKPVTLSQANPENICRKMEQQLGQLGYFYARVDYALEEKANKAVKIRYHVTSGPAIRWNTILFDISDKKIDSLLALSLDESLLKSGAIYRQSNVLAERQRIDTELKNEGYFFFSADDLYFEADSNQQALKLDLTIGLRPGLDSKSTTAFTINNIKVYPHYTLGSEKQDSTFNIINYEGLTIYEDPKEQFFRPKALRRSIFLKTDVIYARVKHNRTLSRIMGMNAFKFADARFSRSSNDSTRLNASVYMTAMEKKSLSTELEMVSKSNNFTGPRIENSFINRNTFGGAERLKIKVFGGIESQLGGVPEGLNSRDFFTYNYGANVDLAIPRLAAPFGLKISNEYVPTTNFSVGYERTHRTQFFTLSSLNANYGYKWKPKASIDHQLNVLHVTYAQLSNTSQEFDQRLQENPLLAASFSEQFILGPEYKFVYNNRRSPQQKTALFYAATNDLSNPFGGLGDRFSEYVRHSSDFRIYQRVGKKSQIVSRVYAAVGVPLGADEQLPYVKQYFSGGPNGLRAFRARSIGPGIFRSDDSGTGFLDQNGDVKLEFNLEYRYDVNSVLKTALFADMGNVWLYNENPQQPGSGFNSSTAIDALAIGVGAGVRLDFTFFLFRFDLAFPVRQPKVLQPSNTREINQKPVLNVAIGYPF